MWSTTKFAYILVKDDNKFIVFLIYNTAYYIGYYLVTACHLQ